MVHRGPSAAGQEAEAQRDGQPDKEEGRPFIPRWLTSKTRSYSACSVEAIAIPPSTKNTIDVVPTTAAWMADGEANR